MKVWQFFETHPIFRYEEFSSFMASQGNTRPKNCGPLLNYHQKVGNLVNIRKYLYAVKSIFDNNLWIDPYLIAAKLSDNSIIAYHTALELHGIAYSTFNEVTYLTNRQKAPFTYEGQLFRPITQQKALIESGLTDFDVDTINRSGMKINVTSLERTIVDVLDRPDLGGGWEEIWRSLEYVIRFDLNKMIFYTLYLKNSTVVAKVGYFLENRPAHLAVDPKYIEKLLPHIPKQPHYMNRTRQVKEKGKYIEKWQLIVPLEIINRTWEEPGAKNI
jgi:predicted transcriptional regulator of viral defense system